MDETEQVTRCDAARRLIHILSCNMKVLTVTEEKFLSAHLGACPPCAMHSRVYAPIKTSFFQSIATKLGLGGG